MGGRSIHGYVQNQNGAPWSSVTRNSSTSLLKKQTSAHILSDTLLELTTDYEKVDQNVMSSIRRQPEFRNKLTQMSP